MRFNKTHGAIARPHLVLPLNQQAVCVRIVYLFQVDNGGD
jgi:hypothetical protein